MYTIHLFAGAGGGILADILLGHTPIAACEIEDYPRRVLLQRQLDGILPAFPVWDDVKTLRADNPECREAFDEWKRIKEDLCICGGFPCTNVSTQSAVFGNNTGLDGECSGLWSEMFRVIGEVRPKKAFIENSPVLVVRGLDRVICDLASLGYSARWGIIGANCAGYDHKRDRVWIVADRDGFRLERRNNHQSERPRKSASGSMAGLCQNQVRHDIPAPDAFGVANGMASRMDRLKAIGNGQVSSVAALAWKILTNRRLEC